MEPTPVDLVRYFATLGTEQLLFYGWLLVVGINVASFALFGLDKRSAVNGRWRVREATLIRFAIFGGWPGAYAGRSYFRHKTRKQPFNDRLITASVMNIVLVCGFGYYALNS